MINSNLIRRIKIFVISLNEIIYLFLQSTLNIQVIKSVKRLIPFLQSFENRTLSLRTVRDNIDVSNATSIVPELHSVETDTSTSGCPFIVQFGRPASRRRRRPSRTIRDSKIEFSIQKRIVEVYWLIAWLIVRIPMQFFPSTMLPVYLPFFARIYWSIIYFDLGVSNFAQLCRYRKLRYKRKCCILHNRYILVVLLIWS